MDLFETMENCRAMRRLKPDPVPDELVAKILQAGTCAPSGGNAQKWRFMVLKDRRTKDAVTVWYKKAYDEIIGPRYASVAPPPGVSPEKFKRQHDAVDYLTNHFADAPVWIVACLEDGANPGPSAGASIYPAVQNMVLACRAVGLGTTLTNRHMFFQKEVDKALGLPDGVHSYAILPIGYPMGKFGPVKRAALAAVVYQDRWGAAVRRMSEYDFIVVGAGSAGAAVAYRLSADPKNKVLLLEAGAADNPWTRLPVGSARLITNPAANWLYSAEPEANTNGRRIPVPRGKLLGGSSAINGMAFVRGQAQDFDTWAQMGNPGWSYADVLPIFKRMESYDGGGDDRFRGRDGPVRVTNPRPREPIFQALIEAAAQVGIAHNPDYNGANQDGIVMSQATIVAGKRMSTARCYLDPAARRPNLRIVTDALTEALLLDGRCCTGVRYAVGGTSHEAKAAREVVVCAGSVNSPQLLELSGIGQPERLRALGIDVKHALPGVGENLRDHYAPRTRWLVGQKGYTYNDTARGLGLVRQALRYAVTRRGLLASVGAPMRAFVRSREGLAAPDLLLGWVPMFTVPGPRGPNIARQSGVSCYAHPMRPESKGTIHITSADPHRPPAIHFNFLSAPVDAELTVKAVRIARAIMTAPAMQELKVTEQAPGPERTTDEAILAWVKSAAETTYHPVGTCKMGIDPMAVVDPRLRVHGIQGLRVADASIMPTLTSGNTNAPSIMIGEKAADLILKDHVPLSR